MKLQIAFDLIDLDKAVEIACKVTNSADVIEIGTLLIYKHGAKAIEAFRNHLPQNTLLADAKIIDRGKEASSILLNAGADWITVMAGTNKDVIHSVCTAAHNLNKKVMLDLLDSASPGQSALEAKSLGVDALLFHQTYDEEQPLLFLDRWEMVRGNTQLPIHVSAKITRDSIQHIFDVKPDGIIIGKAITAADNPEAEARFFYELCNNK
ncbi:MAG: orotidine 5'-phosphate decarboxylase [Candidatus Babeliales bacterium]|nr:orotidine 5'-phosphate decarboxylase [Candidatus Babeliales bacterium]